MLPIVVANISHLHIIVLLSLLFNIYHRIAIIDIKSAIVIEDVIESPNIISNKLDNINPINV